MDQSAIFECGEGHEWEAPGVWEGSTFLPDDQDAVLCPECDDTYLAYWHPS